MSVAILRNRSRAASRSSTISFGQYIGIEEVVGLFQALVTEPEDIKASFPALTSEVQKFRMSPFLPTLEHLLITEQQE
jgi:hypothetical protein